MRSIHLSLDGPLTAANVVISSRVCLPCQYNTNSVTRSLPAPLPSSAAASKNRSAYKSLKSCHDPLARQWHIRLCRGFAKISNRPDADRLGKNSVKIQITQTRSQRTHTFPTDHTALLSRNRYCLQTRFQFTTTQVRSCTIYICSHVHMFQASRRLLGGIKFMASRHNDQF